MARPFWRLLRRYPQIPSRLLEGTDSVPDDVRVPVALGQEFLRNVVAATGVEDLGLLAAREAKIGTFEVLEFTALSAPTWRAAIETAFRYSHLMNEAADFRIELAGDEAHLVLGSTVALTRAGIDFQNAAFYLTCARWFDERPPELEVWFTYPKPVEVVEHRATFGDAPLRFGAPWNGFVFDAARLETKNRKRRSLAASGAA